MVESPASKESSALSIINFGMAKSKNPCVCFSGGKNSLALLHMVKMQDPGRLSVIHSDTGSEFSEVQSYIQKMKKLWKLDLIIVKRDDPTEDFSNEMPCSCTSRVAKMLAEILSKNNYDCIFIGETLDSGNFLSEELKKYPDVFSVTVSPLTSFTNTDIWDYIRIHHIPICSLYDKGYHEISCISCDRKADVKPQNNIGHADEKIMREKLRKLGYL
jgi:phosphoadenosine phosphosulfate reductase